MKMINLNEMVCFCLPDILNVDLIFSSTYLDEHELVHGLVPLQQHHAGLQAAAQEHTPPHAASCRTHTAVSPLTVYWGIV